MSLEQGEQMYFKVLDGFSIDGLEKKNATRFKHKIVRECVAKSLGGCSGGLTGEHVISQCVLDIFPEIKFRTPDGNRRPFGNSTTLNLLCQHHNNSFTAIDDEMGVFFQSLINLSNASVISLNFHHAESFAKEVTVSGYLIERWFLKTLLYLQLFSSRIRGDSDFFGLFPLGSTDVLRPVFTEEPISQPFGLHLLPRTDNSLKAEFEIKYIPIEAINSRIVDHFRIPYGLELRFFGFRLFGLFNITTLSNQTFEAALKDWLGEDFGTLSKTRRPLGLRAKNKKDEEFSTIYFSW